MGGFSSSVIYGKPVKYDDLCEVEIWNAGLESRKVLARYIETSDEGRHWFRLVSEHDSVRGDDVFHDEYAEVGNIRVIGKETPELFSSEGI